MSTGHWLTHAPQVTHDHSHVGWLRRQGRLNEREARTHPRKNALQQALGAGHQFVEPHIGAVAHQPGDRFLLCTDGVTEGLEDRALAAIVRRTDLAAQECIDQLLLDGLEASGNDNLTAILVRLS